MKFPYLFILIGCNSNKLRLWEVEAADPLLLGVCCNFDDMETRLVLVQRVEHNLKTEFQMTVIS